MINLLTVAKAPIPGLVKTRLMPALTAPEAASLAATSLLDTLDAVVATPATTPVVALDGCLDEAMAGDDLSEALARCRVIEQRGSGLGSRLARAFRDAGGPILQIGMDTPQVTPELLTETLQPLRSDTGPDAVLGLAVDGGWWTLGLRDASHAQVLTDVPMSRPDTGEATLRALVSSGLSVAMAPMLRDVDTVADAVGVAAQVPYGRFGRLAYGLLNGDHLSLLPGSRA